MQPRDIRTASTLRLQPPAGNKHIVKILEEAIVIEDPMERRRAHDNVESVLKRKMQEVTGNQANAHPGVSAQMFPRRAQHILREIHGDDAAARQSIQQFRGQPTGATTRVEDAFVAPQLQPRQHLFSPTDLRGRETMVNAGIPLTRIGYGFAVFHNVSHDIVLSQAAPCQQFTVIVTAALPSDLWKNEVHAMRNADQIAAIAQLRWRVFINGLRNRRGKMEFASRVLVSSGFAIGGLSGFAGAIAASWYFVSQGQPEFLAVVLWPILLFWQFFPVMATAFTNNQSSTELLHFPLSYPSYFLIRLVYGLLDPASALGSVFLIGALIGITGARPLLFPMALLALFVFGLFNLVLMQMIFAWLERWLAQRRTREVLGILFLLGSLSFQLIGPAMQRVGRSPHPGLRRAVQVGSEVQSKLPPGLASASIAQTSHGKLGAALSSFLVLAALTAVVGYLLHLRIRAQFHGENLSEAAARPAMVVRQAPQIGWELPGFSESVAAVFEKEMRYLSRSGPMLLTLIMPVFMLLIFRLGPLSTLRHSSGFSRAPDMALPGSVAYALLILTNLVYNSFGADGGGVQFFYASPVQFRQIVLAKNLTHAGVLLLEAAFAWIAVTYLYGVPHVGVAAATLAALLFAAPLNFTAGNLLSMYAPKKRDFSTFGRQNVSQTTVLASFGMQIVIVGIGVGVFALAHVYANPWIAVVIFLILASASIPVYFVVLKRLDGIALGRRETLVSELCRA
jgi:ABC-2 type transport system permease protein